MNIEVNIIASYARHNDLADFGATIIGRALVHVKGHVGSGRTRLLPSEMGDTDKEGLLANSIKGELEEPYRPGLGSAWPRAALMLASRFHTQPRLSSHLLVRQ